MTPITYLACYLAGCVLWVIGEELWGAYRRTREDVPPRYYRKIGNTFEPFGEPGD